MTPLLVRKRVDGSADIINGQVKSADIGTGQVQSIDVKSEGLTGEDVADRSGVDTCVSSTTRIGQLCFRAENLDRNWNQAQEAVAVDDNGSLTTDGPAEVNETACVTTPTS